MRLGASRFQIHPSTRTHTAYGLLETQERHRHRYEVNNRYRDRLTQAGLVVAGTYEPGNLVEVIELRDHPWFVAGQFHPEFKSRPLEPHPLFRAFVEASLKGSSETQAVSFQVPRRLSRDASVSKTRSRSR